ncbi:MAG: FKBP-type peptidyl-prolyl cis-trans isomerase [Waddliaceae bacterium]
MNFSALSHVSLGPESKRAFFPNTDFSKKISFENQIVLEKFFKALFEQSECGFVFYQKKPVCEEGYWIVDPIFPGIERHRCNVYFKEGARVWKQLNLTTNKEYVLSICEVSDGLDENMNGILFIHRKLFLETVKRNIELFQYVIGPEVSPQFLLDKLEDPAESVGKLLKQDNALTGIIFGFGTQNSLVGSRMERLIKEFSSPEIPPIKPLLSRLHPQNNSLSLEGLPHTLNKKHLLFSETMMPTGQEELKPSFGFDSITQEFQALSQEITGTSEKLDCERPWFAFSRLKDDPESVLLIQELETTQTKIQKLLKSPTFFPQVLKAITSEEISLQKRNFSSSSLLAFTSEEAKHLPAIVAEGIFHLIHEEDDIFFEAFYRGMLDAENGKPLSSHDNRVLSKLFYDQQVLKNLCKAKKNLHQCEMMFNELKRDSAYFSVAPNKLYYKISKVGRGSHLKNEKRVSVHYTISSGPMEALLCRTGTAGIPCELDLSECISGFHHGMLGMQIGEKREIYIHPSLAYGIYTTLDRGHYLKAEVQLLKIYPDQTFAELPPMQEIDIESEIPQDVEEKHQKSQRETGYYRGHQTWSHYKHCDLYTLSQVLDCVKKLKNGKSPNLPSSIDSNRVINRLHWNLYNNIKNTPWANC